MSLPSGSSLGHYRLVAPLGAGGMGEVYRATDTKLERDIALKVLPADLARDADRLTRFRREARAVAALNHPNIVTIYSVEESEGIHFFTMELVEGQALDRLISEKGLAGDRLLTIVTSIADALAAAHDKGIVHRDLKPANVMLTSDGRVKVLDFGLAKVTAGNVGPGYRTADVTLLQTRDGVVMGTVPYMSPEQVAGRAIDHRTDIFSLGVMLYEMASGRRPFEGASSIELASAILRDTPPSISHLRHDLPPALPTLIARCLEKDPQHRVQTAREVSSACRDLARHPSSSFAAPIAVRPPSTSGSGAVRHDEGFWVAVLPFRYAGTNADLVALAEGLSEELVTGLSRFSYLRVMSRGSTVSYANQAADARAVGTEIGARYVMEGSLRQAGTQLRVVVQLTDTESGAHLWAETYHRAFQPDAVFELQDDLVPRIVSTVADWYGILPRSMSEAVRSKPVDGLSPYEALLRAFGYYERVTPDEHAAVRPVLERAVEQAPGHGAAWALLSMVYGEEHRFGWNAGPDPLGRALQAARRAAEAAPSSHFSHLALAQAHYFRREIDAFRNAAERAIALNPMDGATVEYLGHLLAFAGDWERGCQLGEMARQLNPNHPPWYWALPFLDAYRRRDYEAARALMPKAYMPGQHFTLALFAALRGQLGEREAAAETVRELLALKPDFASIARGLFEKWYLPELVEQLIDGLRKAGLDVDSDGSADTPSVDAAIDRSPPVASGASADQAFRVAVLPFKYAGANPDLAALADGLSEEIVTGLSRFSYLRVIARGSTSRFLNQAVDVRTVGKEIGARYVMEGSVRQAGGQLRVAAQLVDAVTGAHLWAETYDRPFQSDQIFAMQDELVPRIVSTCADSFGVLARSISDAVREKPGDQLTPYEALMRGFGYHHRLSEIEHAQARAALERAVEAAPGNADCWAMLSWIYSHEYGHDFNPRPGSLDRALTAARRAVDIAPSNHLAHQALGVALFFRKDIAGCLNAAERAMALNPLDGSNEAIFLITFTGDWERGRSLVARAMELNPHHPSWYRVVFAVDEYRTGHYRASIEQTVKTNLPGLFWTHFLLAAAYGQLGEIDAARGALGDLLALKPEFAQTASDTLSRWFQPQLTSHLREGLVKAGLAPGVTPSSPQVAGSRTIDSSSQVESGFWVAVLPFKYGGANPDLTTLAEGLSEEIVTGLSRFSYLRVISRSATLRYVNQAVDVRAVGKEIGARYVMEGSLRLAGSQLRLAVQLTEAVSGAHLWANTYSRSFPPDDLFALQDDLVPRIVSTVADAYGVLPHSMSQAVRSRPLDELTPDEALLRSLRYAERVTPEEHADAKAAVERALEQSPSHSDCWAMLSIMLADEYGHGFGAARETLDRALQAARRAVDANPSNHRAYQALAWAMFLRKEFQACRQAGERALALNPMDACTAVYVGQAIAYSGDWERGVSLIARAIDLNPHHPGWYWYASFLNAYRQRDYTEALAVALKMNLPGVSLVDVALAATHGQLGAHEAARNSLHDLLALKPDYASVARQELGKWFDAGLVEHLIEGLRKAGLEVAAPSGSASSSSAPRSGPASVAPSIAVLPFANMSADQDQNYFSDGLAEEIINLLAQTPGLKVIARTSAFAFRGKEEDIRRIGETLGVAAILQGSVRRAGGRVRVTAQLIDAAGGDHLWSERFDREMTDVFALQDEIASAVAAALKVRLTGKSADERTHEPNVAAYEAFLKGRHHYYQFSPDAFARAEQEFTRATELDATWAEPYAALGDLSFALGFYGWRPLEEMIPRSRAAARQALDFVPSHAMAHAVLGSIAGLHDYDWTEADEQFRALREAESLPPNVRGLYAMFYLLARGRFDEASREMTKVTAEDPLNSFWRARRAWIFMNSDRYDDAIAEARQALELDASNYQARMMIALSLTFQGKLTEAREPAEEVFRIAAFDALNTGLLAGLLTRAGETQRASEVLGALTGVVTIGMMAYHLVRGDIDAAIDWYQKDIEQRRPNAPMIAFAGWLTPLRASPRWPAVARMMNLRESEGR